MSYLIQRETTFGYGAGLGSYWRLVDYGWKEEVKVLDYGPLKIPKTRSSVSRSQLACTPIISGPNRESDWALAQNWEALIPTTFVNHSSPENAALRGRNVFAGLSGLDPRPLRADKYSKAPISDLRPGPATDIG